jgi:hypothetical protein
VLDWFDGAAVRMGDITVVSRAVRMKRLVNERRQAWLEKLVPPPLKFDRARPASLLNELLF